MQSHVITNLKASGLSSHVASLYRDLPGVVVNRHSLFTHWISQATGERLSLIFLGFFFTCLWQCWPPVRSLCVLDIDAIIRLPSVCARRRCICRLLTSA